MSSGKKERISNRRDNNDSKDNSSYFAISRRKRRRYMMIIIPIVAAIAVVVVVGSVITLQSNSNARFGPLGSAHVHAAFLVKLDGKVIDFSQDKYQLRSQFIHVEKGDGTTLHRHATGVPVGEFFKSIHMDIKNNCFITDNGTQYCDNGTKKLRYFVNGIEKQSIMDYVLNDNDRILVVYGNENNNQIKQDIDAVRQTKIIQ